MRQKKVKPRHNIFPGSGNIDEEEIGTKPIPEALAEKLKILTSVYDSMSEGIALHEITYDHSGKPVDYILIDVNPAYEKITGLNKNDIIGKKATLIYSVEEAPYLDIYSKVASTGDPVSFETFFPPMDKHFSISVFSPAKGKFGTVFLDITNSKKTEQALMVSEERFRIAIRNSPIGIAIQNKNLVYEWAYNQKSRHPEEIIGKTDADLFAPEDMEWITPLKQELLLTGKEINIEKWLTSNGRRYFLGIHYEPIRDSAGNMVGIGAATIDLTEKKLIEETLKKSENLLKSVLDNVNSGVALIDETGRFSVYNPLFLKLFGLSEGSNLKNVNDQNWADWKVFNEDGTLLAVDDHPVRKASMTGKRIDQQLVGVMLPSGGEIIWMLISAEPIFKDNGKIEKIICTYHDITGRKKVEQSLRESERKLSLIQENMSEGLMVFDPDGNVIYQNPASLRIHGYQPGDGGYIESRALAVSWKGWDEQGRPLSFEEWPLSRVIHGERIQNQVLRARRSDTGHEFIASYNGCPILSDDGKISFAFITIRDITATQDGRGGTASE